MNKTKVTFVYDEQAELWSVFVEGVKDSLEARQAFNAVVVSCGDAIPNVQYNKANQQPNGSWEIVVGQIDLEVKPG